ncbi:hypothetical protein ACIQ7Q_24855 [Streptomyces sp. NPDC096176]|uniref:hypothetical protein n=1 Tax=Streptomyces sp. NPDC096176 TaxID=3366079 RepID=UPI0037FF1E2C
MTTTPRERFSMRIGVSDAVDAAPYDGVPDPLLRPLVEDLQAPSESWATLVE